MSKHTPGPWKWLGVPSGEYSLLIAGDETTPVARAKVPISQADKRLIAAAPDMLAACELALRRLLKLDAEDNVAELGPCPACEAIRAAMKKAGVTPDLSGAK